MHGMHPTISLEVLRNKLLDDLSGHGEMESPDFLPSGDDLLRGENEPVVAGVPQLHGKAVGDAGLAQGPIQGAATCWIQHAGNATNLIFLVMHCFQGVMAQVCHPCMLYPASG